MLLFTITNVRANTVFKTLKPWSPTLLSVQSQRNATDFQIHRHSSWQPLCFPFGLHPALKNARLHLLSYKLWLKPDSKFQDNEHFEKKQPITAPTCHRAAQLQHV